MDFPVCPQCKQSVIDDDATECPFCGASMKGKGPAKPAGPKVSSPSAKPAETKPAAPKPGVTGATPPGKPPLKPGGRFGAKLPAGGDDFPFDIEMTSGKAAIQALPSASKQRTLQVVCPMCDTAGYVPPTALGQDVRCANQKCVMPVFTVPNPKKTETVVAAPPPPPPSKLPMILGLLVVAIAVAGGGYYFMFMMTPKPKVLDAEALEELKAMQQQNKPKQNGGPVGAPVGNPKADNAEPVVGKVTNDQLISQALKIMESTIYTGNKPFCRKLCAEAYAMTGDDASARKHLQALLDVGKQAPYYRISPYVQLFWVEFSAGQKKEAMQSLDFAKKEASKIPLFGRMRFEIAGQLAAALVAAGQNVEAVKLLEGIRANNPKDLDPQLAAELQIALDGRVVPIFDSLTVLPWEFPQEVAVTATLLNRGMGDLSLAWASGLANDVAKTECLAYWAEEFARESAAAGDADADGKIENAAKSLPPELAARIWVGAGHGRLISKDAAGVAAALKLAQEQLDKVGQPPQGPQMPDQKSMIRFKLPEATTPKFLKAAMAAGEIAFLQAQSADTIPQAEKNLDLALAFADATAPSFTIAAKAHKESEEMGPLGRVALAKKLVTRIKDEDARTWALNYKDAVDRIYHASQKRFYLQSELLSHLVTAGHGLPQRIWIIVNSRASSNDQNLKEDFFATTLPGELVEALKGTPEGEAVKGAWTQRAKGAAPPRPVAVEFNELLKTNPAGAVKLVESKLGKSPDQRDDILVKAAARLAAENKYDAAFAMATKIREEFAKWESLRVAAAISARQGNGEKVLELVPAQNKNQGIETERAAICRGLITGLKAAEK